MKNRAPILGVEGKKDPKQVFPGERAGRDENVTACLPMVERVAGYFARRTGLDRRELVKDLVSEGCLGLMLARKNFDSAKALARGTKFSTYAYWWVRRYILRAIIHGQLMISVPENVSELHREYRKSFARLSVLTGREPTRNEVFKKLDLTPRQQEMLERREAVRESSFDQLLNAGGDRRTIGDMIVGDEHLEDIDTEIRRRDIVRRCLEPLDEMERELIVVRFGLSGSCPMTYREIADYLKEKHDRSVSRQRVHQVITRALEKMRSGRCEGGSAGTLPGAGGQARSVSAPGPRDGAR